METGEPSSKRTLLSEDWTVVLLGLLIIFVTLIGFILPVPSFGWKNSEELSAKVFSLSNLAVIGLQFVFVLFIALLGALFTRRSLKIFSCCISFCLHSYHHCPGHNGE